MKMFKYIWKAQ